MPVATAPAGGLTDNASFPQTVSVGGEGGLLSHLTVRRNLVLPLEYHGRDTSHAEEDAAMLLALCGEDAASLDGLMERYPDSLSLYERRLVGFVRALLVEPETLVMEDIFVGISADEKTRAMRWPEVFRLRFPFREMKYRKGGGMVSAGSVGSA